MRTIKYLILFIFSCISLLSCSKNDGSNVYLGTWRAYSLELDCIDGFPFSDSIRLADRDGCFIGSGYGISDCGTFFFSNLATCNEIQFDENFVGNFIDKYDDGIVDKSSFEYSILQNNNIRVCFLLQCPPNPGCIEFTINNERLSLKESIPTQNQDECYVNVTYKK